MEDFKKLIVDTFAEFIHKYFYDSKHIKNFSIYSYENNYTYFYYYDTRGKVVIDLNTVIFCLENSVSKETLMEWIDFIILYDDEYNDIVCFNFPYTRITLDEFINKNPRVDYVKERHEKNLKNKSEQQGVELKEWIKDNEEQK